MLTPLSLETVAEHYLVTENFVILRIVFMSTNFAPDRVRSSECWLLQASTDSPHKYAMRSMEIAMMVEGGGWYWLAGSVSPSKLPNFEERSC